MGSEGTVLETVTAADGRIRLDGEIWSARAYDETPHPVGSTVRVVKIDGATALVL